MIIYLSFNQHTHPFLLIIMFYLCHKYSWTQTDRETRTQKETHTHTCANELQMIINIFIMMSSPCHPHIIQNFQTF